jgi:hypothetical protein
MAAALAAAFPFFLPLLRKRKKETTAMIAATAKPAMTTTMVVPPTGSGAITASISRLFIWFTPLIVETAYQLARVRLR